MIFGPFLLIFPSCLPVVSIVEAKKAATYTGSEAIWAQLIAIFKDRANRPVFRGQKISSLRLCC